MNQGILTPPNKPGSQFIGRHSQRWLRAFSKALVCIFAVLSVLQVSAVDITSLKKKAELGNPEAQFKFAECLRRGDSVARDREAATLWYRRAAEQNFPPAQVALGEFLRDRGEGEENAKEAIKWYRRAADQGNARAYTLLGMAYERGEGVEKDESDSLRYLKKAEELGDPHAIGFKAYKLFFGDPSKTDVIQGIKQFKKSAEAGDEASQTWVALIYMTGLNGKADMAEAVRWFTKAAEKGEVTAQMALWKCYGNGLGVERNAKTASLWLSKARGEAPQSGGDVDGKTAPNVSVKSNQAKAPASRGNSVDEGLDAYERYMTQYIECLKQAQVNPMAALSKLPALQQAGVEMQGKLEAMKSDMTAAQLAKFMQIQTKLLTAAQSLK